MTHLKGLKGILQVDGYVGYRKLADRGEPCILLAARSEEFITALPNCARRRHRRRSQSYLRNVWDGSGIDTYDLSELYDGHND